MTLTCDECGAEFAGRPGQRFCSRPCRNAYWNARKAPDRPSRKRAPRARATTPAPRRPRAKPAPVIGTQRWLTDPTVPACRFDGCYWDAPCPVHGRTRPAAPVLD